MDVLRATIGCAIISLALTGCKTTRGSACAPCPEVPIAGLPRISSNLPPETNVAAVAYQEPLPHPEIRPFEKPSVDATMDYQPGGSLA
jgi:hypothetical protein